MKTCSLFILVVGFSMLSLSNSLAQNYKTAVGARIGYPLTLSGKYFIDESIAVEANLGLRAFSGYSWVALSAAGLKHKPLDVLDGLNWYYGAGLSVYFWRFDQINTLSSSSSLGLQGYVGLDYTFKKSPINVSIDWTPTFFINGYTSGLGTRFGGLGIRYTLN
jgi:outer membrane protein W